ncbi:MAG TPA: DUF87 domain-containing protein [Candidatus Tectomicrobia bacterium]|nr:DUF87 domain-containing protein [Candidatus Tectomicrobia bacterium]
MHLAVAKIRKVTDPAWHPWDGWIPRRDIIVTKTADREMLRRCIPQSEDALGLGRTPAGQPFHVERAALGAVNLIVGAKGSGTSYLAKVIGSELIDHGARCVVFDTTGTYVRLSSGGEDSFGRRRGRPGVVPLVAGESLKLGMLHFGLDALSAMLRQFGLPRALAMFFGSHVARCLERLASQADANQSPPFLGINDLMQLAQSLEGEGRAVASGAILSCLDAIKKTAVLATQPAEAMMLWEGLAQIRQGGALVIDLSRLPRRAQTVIVFSLVGILKDIAERDSATESKQSLFLFFDDAEALVSPHFTAEDVMPARPLALTSFFVTTMVSGLARHLLSRADNLFLRRLTSAHDVHHLAKSGLVDADTLRAVGRALGAHHGLLMGKASGGYPMIFAVNPLAGVGMTDERSAFAPNPAAGQVEPAGRAGRPLSTQTQAPIGAGRSLPLFPDEPAVRSATPEVYADERMAATSQTPAPSVAQVMAMWDHIVTRVARRRRILETVLSAARPLRIAGQGLVLGFPPQHRFQQELVESEEYRSLLEEELKKAFGVSLEVTTEVHTAEMR